MSDVVSDAMENKETKEENDKGVFLYLLYSSNEIKGHV